MRSDGFIYGLVLLLIFAGFISFKQTVRKIEKSEGEVNLKYVEIQEKYFEQKQRLLKLLDEVESNCSELTDTMSENLSYIAGPGIHSDLNFEQFRKDRKMQEELDRMINKTDSLIFTICPDLPISMQNRVEKINMEKESLDSLKNIFNTLARQHNAFIKKFPRNFYSSFYHFHSKPYYTSDN